MNRRAFLKSLLALPSLALPFIPSVLVRAFGRVTGTHEVTGLGFEPSVVVFQWSEPQRFGGTIEHISGQLDIVSFDADGFTLTTESPGTVHYAAYELPDDYTDDSDWLDDLEDE